MSEVKPFTREDVSQLRRLAEALISWDRHTLTEEGRAHIRSIADRIEARLPPEQPHGTLT